jgi:hypothetical protein
MLSGQTIQVKHLATTNSLIASVHGSMLVNKES